MKKLTLIILLGLISLIIPTDTAYSQQGFRQVQTSDGIKITNNDRIFFLTQPSNEYLRDRAVSSLKFRSTSTDERNIPTGKITRSNNYPGRYRTFQEFDNQNNPVGNPIIKPIPQSEINEHNRQQQWIDTKTRTRNITTLVEARTAIDSLLRFIEKGDGLDSPFPETLVISPNINQTGTSTPVLIPVNISEVPSQGLSGYILRAIITEPSIAQFTDVIFPPEFPLNDHQPDPIRGQELTSISGADTLDVIQGRETTIELLTLQIQPLSPGTTQIIIGVESVDDDSGNPIEILTRPSTLTIR